MKGKVLSFTPSLKSFAFFEKLQEKVEQANTAASPLLHSIGVGKNGNSKNGSSKKKISFKLPNFKKPNIKLPNLSYKKLAIYSLTILLAVGLLYVLVKGFSQGSQVAGTSTAAIQLKDPKGTETIGREFTFPLKDANGNEVSQLKYYVEKVEKLDEIIVKGQKATAIKGRTFLIFTIKISNEFNKAIEIDSKDYVRLSVNGNRDEWLAPDIHNDPVLVQAISTKFTRVGFPLNDSDKDLVLRIGEIDGSKEEIPLGI